MLSPVFPLTFGRPLDKKKTTLGFTQEMNKLKWVFLRKSQFTNLSKRFVPRLRTRFCTTDPEFSVMTKGFPPEKQVNLF